jgi:hypothetical protein
VTLAGIKYAFENSVALETSAHADPPKLHRPIANNSYWTPISERLISNQDLKSDENRT